MTASLGRPLRIGIAGLGFGASLHAPVLRSFPDVQLVGIAGRSVDKAQGVADMLGIPKGCGSVSDLLDLNLDAITLALPPDQVFYAAQEALLRGIPVLCEKPLCDSVERSVTLAKQAVGITTAINFIFAELDVFKHLKKIVDNRMLGGVRHANLLWLTESQAYRTQTWGWKTDANRRGGVLSLFGSHIAYLAEWLFGPVERLQAQFDISGGAAFAPIGVHVAEDLMNGRLCHQSGVTLSFTAGNANPGLSVHRWTVVFDEGTIILENKSIDYAAFSLCTLRRRDPPVYEAVENLARDGRSVPFSRLARRFVDAARNGSQIKPNFEDGVRAQRLDDWIRCSNCDKTEVFIPN